MQYLPLNLKNQELIDAKYERAMSLWHFASKRDREYENVKTINMLHREIELLKLGCTIEEHAQGILVNGKFIVGHHKWRNVNKGVWYRYKDIPTFVAKYVNNF
jgi:hypothetical protein